MYTPQVDTYYFDASDAGPTDGSAVWTDDANAFDGSESTDANSTAASGNLTAEGTNAPSSNTYSNIIGVRFRVLSYANRAMTYRVREDTAVTGTLLATVTPGVVGSSGSPVWSSWVQVDTPATGWTWAKVQQLAIDIVPSGTGSTEVYRIEVEVTSAPTINNIWGAESGGLEEASAFAFVSANTTQAHSGTYSYQFTNGATIDIDPFESVADAGSGYVIGFWKWFGDVTPDSEITVLELDDGTAGTNQFFQLFLETDGDIRIAFDSGTPDTISSPSLTNSTWHFFELYFVPGASGSYELFLDESSIGSGTSKDMSDSGGTVGVRFASYIGSGSSHYADDIYFMSGAASASDRLGGCEVYSYRSSKASWTPDDGGDNLNVGSPTPSASTGWQNTQEVTFNDTNWAGYDGALAGAVNTDDVGGSAGTGGPNTDANITGTIPAAKAIMRMSRGNGGGTDHFILFGNDTDGTTRSADLDPTASAANYFMVSQSVNIVPTSSQYCQIGFEATGAQDFECYDMLATILHVPAVAAGTSLAPFNPHYRQRRLLVR